MERITEMDRAAVRRIDAACKEALEAVAASLGIQAKVGGGTFDPVSGTFRPKVVFSLADSAEREWAQWASLYGLQADDFGREFRQAGHTFKVCGIAPRSRVRPVIASREDGKRFKFAAEGVKRALARSA